MHLREGNLLSERRSGSEGRRTLAHLKLSRYNPGATASCRNPREGTQQKTRRTQSGIQTATPRQVDATRTPDAWRGAAPPGDSVSERASLTHSGNEGSRAPREGAIDLPHRRIRRHIHPFGAPRQRPRPAPGVTATAGSATRARVPRTAESRHAPPLWRQFPDHMPIASPPLHSLRPRHVGTVAGRAHSPSAAAESLPDSAREDSLFTLLLLNVQALSAGSALVTTFGGAVAP